MSRTKYMHTYLFCISLHFEAENMNVAWLERLTQYSQRKFGQLVRCPKRVYNYILNRKTCAAAFKSKGLTGCFVSSATPKYQTPICHDWYDAKGKLYNKSKYISYVRQLRPGSDATPLMCRT